MNIAVKVQCCSGSACRLDQLQLLHGILNSIILHILCKERGIWLQLHIVVSHENTVLRMFKHRKVVGAVTEHVSVLKRHSVLLQNHIDGSRLGIIRRNTFIEPVSAVYDVIFQPQRPRKSGQIALLVCEYAELI